MAVTRWQNPPCTLSFYVSVDIRMQSFRHAQLLLCKSLQCVGITFVIYMSSPIVCFLANLCHIYMELTVLFAYIIIACVHSLHVSSPHWIKTTAIGMIQKDPVQCNLQASLYNEIWEVIGLQYGCLHPACSIGRALVKCLQGSVLRPHSFLPIWHFVPSAPWESIYCTSLTWDEWITPMKIVVATLGERCTWQRIGVKRKIQPGMNVRASPNVHGPRHCIPMIPTPLLYLTQACCHNCGYLHSSLLHS